MPSSKKYLIVGQGLAGSILSMQMHERGIDHILIDQDNLSMSSKVAAGLINPVVLKRFKMVHNAIEFLDYSQRFYYKWEKKLQQAFYKEIPIHHIFSKQENQNEWMEKSANAPFDRFLGDVNPKAPAYLNANYGLGQMKETAWLDTKLFLETYKHYLISKGQLVQARFDPEEIDLYSKKYGVDEIILCTGHLLQRQLKEKILSPTRGELLTIKSKELKENAIYHAGVFILPLGNSLFKVGATYHWNNLTDTPTEEGQTKLLEELRKMFNGEFEVIDHIAGVRPNIKDRKPIMGRYKDFLIFNGLGSRGVLMAPGLSNTFLEYLQEGKEIPAEFDIKRFL